MPPRLQIDPQFRETWEARVTRWLIGRMIAVGRWILGNPKALIAVLFASYLGAYLWGWYCRGTMP